MPSTISAASFSSCRSLSTALSQSQHCGAVSHAFAGSASQFALLCQSRRFCRGAPTGHAPCHSLSARFGGLSSSCPSSGTSATASAAAEANPASLAGDRPMERHSQHLSSQHQPRGLAANRENERRRHAVLLPQSRSEPPVHLAESLRQRYLLPAGHLPIRTHSTWRARRIACGRLTQ